MTRVYFVINENEELMCLGEPWLDGECLYDATPKMATVFFDKKSAGRALRVSRTYASKQRLSTTWKIKEWKVIERELQELTS